MPITFFYTISGIFIFMALVNTLQFFVQKDRVYFWYAVYLSLTAIHRQHFHKIRPTRDACQFHIELKTVPAFGLIHRLHQIVI